MKKNVVFKEDVFLFHQMTNTQPPLFLGSNCRPAIDDELDKAPILREDNLVNINVDSLSMMFLTWKMKRNRFTELMIY